MKTPFHFVSVAAVLAIAGAIPSLGQTTIYEEMKVRSPTPTPNHLTKLRYGAGKFLALGEYGTVISSDNGTAWTAHPTGYARSITDIAFGNGVYVVCGADISTVLTSFDLQSWTESRPAGVPFNMNGIIFQNGRFHLCGSNGTVASSDDGATWTPVATGVTVSLRDILFANGQFIAVGDDNTVVTSPDGTAWTPRPTGIPLQGLNEDLLSVTWLNNLYVVGGKNGTILTSPNGTAWTLREFTEGNDWFYGGIFQGGAYYLTGRQGRLRKTTNFTTWDSVQTAEPGDNDIYGVLNQEGITVAVGRSGSINTSPNLSTWTSRKGGYLQGFSGLAFGAGKFVSADFDGILRTSQDSVAWTDAFTMPGDAGLSDITFADGKFVAVASSSEITQSANGSQWSAPARQFDGFPGVRGIRFLNGRWFLFGRNGLIRSSTNLSNWTTSDVAPAEEIQDMTFANGIHVAVGTNGAIFTSVNGTAWEPQASGTTRTLNAVAYGNGRFVIGGGLTTVLTSINGIDWSADGVQFPPANIQRLYFREGRFVGFASGGQVGLSPDGMQWSIVSLQVPVNVSAFAEGNDRLAAVGGNGLIMSTDPLPDHTLVVTWSGDGAVVADPPGTTFRQGTVVTLTATPGPNHAFFGWGGDAAGTDNPITVVIDGDKSVSAEFRPTLSGFASWQLSEFNAAERANPAISGATANPDADDRANVFEYLAGTLPKSPDAAPFVAVTTARLGNANYPVVTYTRRKGITDVEERVEISRDLKVWNHNGDGTGVTYTTLFNLVDGPGDSETVSIRSLAPIDPDQPQFLRLAAEVAP